MQVQAIPTLQTNYVWALRPSPSDPGVYLVDPGEAQPVLDYLRRGSLSIKGVLVTHHHWDHTNGLDSLLAEFPVPVFGPDSVSQVTTPVSENNPLCLEGLRLEVIAVPGHTLDHIAYYRPADNHSAPMLFCGDALFAAGCGRLFEGTPEQALRSLKKLSRLPADTEIYCAHEYTLANLAFAQKVEPDNDVIKDRIRLEEQRLEQRGLTLPSRLRDEWRTNPFLRTQESTVKASTESRQNARLDSDLEVFAALRRWKDES